MVRRLLFIVPVALALFAGTAGAAPLDKSANEKIDQAINEHYLATDFRKAEAVLLGVVKACGTQCSPATLGRAWMYVGLVRGSGNQDLAGAREAFDTAVAQDPSVKLDAALSTAETVDVFNQAKSGGGTSAAAASAPSGEPAASAGAIVTMDCTPAVREVQTNRPIPVSCPAPAGAATLELAYRNGPNGSYTTLPFARTGGVLSATVPCEATAAAGALHLYVVASSNSGELVGQWGTPDGPVVIGLVENTKMAPPALPGQKAPERCSGESATAVASIESTGGNADCPPGFPGCSGGGAWGDSCTPAEPCKDGLICLEGVCENAASCDSDADCETGTCEDGFCQSESGGAGGKGPYAKNWVGLHFGMDLPILSGNSVCFRQGGWNDGFRCYEKDGKDPIDNSNIWSTGASGSAVVGTMRLMASYDRFFTPNLAAGARVGFAFGGGKADFNPIHLEGRLSYWFVGMNDVGFNPYVFLGGGVGQVNGKEKAKICDWVTDTTTGAQGCREGTLHEVDAYKLMGLGFVEAGGGALVGVMNNGGILINVAAMYMLPFPGINIQPSLGFVMGF